MEFGLSLLRTMKKPAPTFQKRQRIIERRALRRLRKKVVLAFLRMQKLSDPPAARANIRFSNVPEPEVDATTVTSIFVRPRGGRPRELIVPPTDLSFRRNFIEVASFFQTLRARIFNSVPSWATSPGIDFRALKTLSPGAALVLAAELHRWQIFTRRKLSTIMREEWDPVMSQMLEDFGLFEFLETKDHKYKEQRDMKLNLKFIKYKNGIGVTPHECGELLDHLTSIVGSIEAEKFIFDGLVEALNNAKHHAYPADGGWYGVMPGTWLMCGAYDERNKILTAAVYDMGVGIPRTLPRSGLWEHIKGYIAEFGAHDDAGMIAAAMQAGRTRTGLAERGKGLPIMMRLFDHAPGHLRILSGRGEVRYQSGGSGIRATRRPLSVGGTLIQWQIAKA